MLNKIINHIADFRHWYLWPLLFLAAPLILGLIAQFLNHGKPLLDDPSSIYAMALEWIPVDLSLITAAMYSRFLNHSLTRDEYVKETALGKFVDNLPVLIVFITVLIHFHLHS